MMSSIKKKSSIKNYHSERQNIRRYSIHKKKINIFAQNEKKKIVANNIRTKLLLFIDEENSNYIKTCSTRINYELPKEIIKKYEICPTISFNNPIVHSSNSEIEQLSHRSQKGNETKITTIQKEHDNHHSSSNIRENTTDKSKAIGYYYFTKCLKQIGRDFIDQRKKNVGTQKLEKKDGTSSKRQSGLLIDTELSFIEVIQSLGSNKNKKSSSRSLNKRLSESNKSSNKYFELFMNKQEKDVRNIQNNFDKLHNIVQSIKSIDSLNTDNKQLNTLKNNFDQELFDILHYKGFDLNNLVKSYSFLNCNKPILPNPCFSKTFFNKVLEFEEEDHNQQDITHHKIKSSYIPNNQPSIVNNQDNFIILNKTKSLNIVNENMSKKQRNEINYNDRETNENTGNNVSLYLDNICTECKNFLPERNDEFREYSEDEHTVEFEHHRRGSNIDSNLDLLEYLSDNDFGGEHRMHNNNEIEQLMRSYTQDKFGTIRLGAKKNSDNQIVNLVKCKSNTNLGRCELENSRTSLSDMSRASILSRNKSDITMSSITEMSDDFYEKNL